MPAGRGGGGHSPIWAMGYLGMCSPKGYGFWMVSVWKGYRLFWSEIGYIFHSSLALSIVFMRNYFFHINIPKFVALLKCCGNWKPILVSCGHILEPCTNCRGLKWVFNFSLRSEKGYGNHRFWSEIGFWGLDHTAPPKTLGSAPTPSAIMVVFFHSTKPVHSNCIVRFHGAKKFLSLVDINLRKVTLHTPMWRPKCAVALSWSL